MFTDPTKNLKMFGLGESDIVADLGAGTGFYAVAAGRMVPKGKVYAVDVQKDFIMTAKQKAKEANLSNVECIWGDIEKLGGTKIGNEVVNDVISSNVLFQLDERDKFVDETKRILKKGGRVLLIDWSDASGMGIKNVVPKQKAREMFERKGFTLSKEFDAGAHHYGMIFSKN